VTVLKISGLVSSALLALTLICGAGQAFAAQPFVSYEEVAFRPGIAFPKWQAIQQRLDAEAQIVEHCLAGTECQSPAAADIADHLRELVALRSLDQAEAVQRLVNARPYVEDRRQFGVGDLWQTPLDFWANGGDCEDYAIAKYLALRVLGFSDAQLRLTILTRRSDHEVHAVLLVAVGADWYAADNLRRGLRRLDGYEGWKPEFSVSDAGFWRYVARPAAVEQVAAAGSTRLPEPAADSAKSSAPSAATLRARL
jgi:predicted transglutaminase-like cysteine proteinase